MKRWLWPVGIAAAALVLLWSGAPEGRGCVGGLRGPAPPDSDAPVAAPPQPLERVAALGRIEPGRGVVRVAGPPRPAVVIERLLVEEGDPVKKGQEIASLAGIEVHRAVVAVLSAELTNAERELQRNRSLRRDRVLSESDWQALELDRDVARARLLGAQAELELSTVRAPIAGDMSCACRAAGFGRTCPCCGAPWHSHAAATGHDEADAG